MSTDADDGDDPCAAADEVGGYGHPPKASRFKRGQSGNPSGRPKGAKGRRAIVEKVLLEKQTFDEGGIRKTCTTLEVILLILRNRSFEGDARAFKAMDKLKDQFEPKETRWVGGALIVPEPITLDEWEALYCAKDPSPAQPPPGEKDKA